MRYASTASSMQALTPPYAVCRSPSSVSSTPCRELLRQPHRLLVRRRRVARRADHDDRRRAGRGDAPRLALRLHRPEVAGVAGRADAALAEARRQRLQLRLERDLLLVRQPFVIDAADRDALLEFVVVRSRTEASGDEARTQSSSAEPSPASAADERLAPAPASRSRCRAARSRRAARAPARRRCCRRRRSAAARSTPSARRKSRLDSRRSRTRRRDSPRSPRETPRGSARSRPTWFLMSCCAEIEGSAAASSTIARIFSGNSSAYTAPRYVP